MELLIIKNQNNICTQRAELRQPATSSVLEGCEGFVNPMGTNVVLRTVYRNSCNFSLPHTPELHLCKESHQALGEEKPSKHRLLQIYLGDLSSPWARNGSQPTWFPPGRTVTHNNPQQHSCLPHGFCTQPPSSLQPMNSWVCCSVFPVYI